MDIQPALLPKSQHVTLPIYNLGHDGSGSLALERALQNTPGVTEAFVNLNTEMAYIRYDPELCNTETLTAVIAHSGFGPTFFE